jgi:acetyl-CoA C-acetyltransferase
LPIDGSKALSVTGGLPYFGGPGNNYSMHALAEMTTRLRGTSQRALVTANGGVLSKHAAAALANYSDDENNRPLNMHSLEPYIVSQESISSVAICDVPEAGTIISYTVIFEREKNDLAVVMAQTAEGERFLAHNTQPEILEQIKQASPIGRLVNITSKENRHRFSFAV